MNEEELEVFRENLEREFYSMLERGENVSCFLHFPYNFLSKNIRDYLDELLITEAYNEIESGNLTPESFTVYQDGTMTIRLDKKPQQVELLQRLIDHYSLTEEYEKCSRVQSVLTQILQKQDTE